jgi:hypothetical protein
MNRTIALLLLVLIAVIFTPTDSTSAVAAGNTPSASGHGNIRINDGELRTFSFHAMTRKDGTVTGNTTLHNRDQDVFVKLDIDCLRVVGNTAYVSGVITQHSNPDFLGFKGRFRVVDNGEGANNPPDLMSLVANSPPTSTSDCNSPSNAFPALNDIEGGNVQVKP